MENLVLAPYATVGYQNDILYIGFGSIQNEVIDPNLQKTFLDAMSLWKQPMSADEIKLRLQKMQAHSIYNISHVIDTLVNGRFLISENKYNPNERYSRNALYYNLSGGDPEAVQTNLENKHVAIVGCGGIGNLVSVGLAGFGIGKMSLIDPDHIEESNLTRQILFSEADVNQLKVEVLQRELLKRNSQLKIDIYPQIVDEELLTSIQDIDFIVLSADSYGCVQLVNKISNKLNIAYINVGYVQDIAVWGPLVIPGETGCFVCQDIVVDQSQQTDIVKQMVKTINAGHQAPSNCATNMLASSCALLEIVKYLGEFANVFTLNTRMGFWTHNLLFENQACDRNPNCRVCGHNRDSYAKC